jgi:hypothetical protein
MAIDAYKAALSSRADGGKDLRQRILDALDMKGTFTDDQIVEAVWCSDYERRRLFVADGGKGEAVYQIRSTNAGTWHDVDKERYESTRFERRIVYTAPQAECAPRVSDLTDVISEEAISRLEALMAPECTDGGKCGAGGYCGACKFAECAPREAQPVGQWLRDLRRAHEYLDKGEPFFTGKDCAELADLIESLASPTPERADADTAGAIEPIDILLDRLKSGEDYTTPLHPKKDAK